MSLATEAPGRRARPDLAAGSAAEIRGFRLFGCRSTDALIDLVAGKSAMLMALNAEKLARADHRLRSLSHIALSYPDGYGAVLALRRRGVRSARVAGADLWLRLLRRTAGRERVYLVGSTPDVIQDVADRLREEIQRIQIVGYRDGYLDGDGEQRLLADLRSTDAGVVMLAMGSPRQELLMQELWRAHPALYVGLGGSFDVYVGRRRRAPAIVQRLGLEWAHRFIVDPARLPRLPEYLKFAWLLALNRL